MPWAALMMTLPELEVILSVTRLLLLLSREMTVTLILPPAVIFRGCKPPLTVNSMAPTAVKLIGCKSGTVEADSNEAVLNEAACGAGAAGTEFMKNALVGACCKEPPPVYMKLLLGDSMLSSKKTFDLLVISISALLLVGP